MYEKKLFEQFEELEKTQGSLAKTEVVKDILKHKDGEILIRMSMNDENYFVGDTTFKNAFLKYNAKSINNFAHVSDWLTNAQYAPMANDYKYEVNDFVNFCKNIDRKNLQNQIYNFFVQCDALQKKWFCRVMLKDLRCGIQLKTINKALAKLNMPKIEKFEVQLCDKIDNIEEWNIFPCYVSEKYDGFRCVVEKRDDNIIMTSRQGKDVSGFLPELVEEFKKIPADFILDGEVMAESFNDIQKRIGRKEDNISFVEGLHYRAFDLLYVWYYMHDKETEQKLAYAEERTRYAYLIEFMNRILFGENCAVTLTSKLIDNNNLIRLENRMFVPDTGVLQMFYYAICEKKGEGVIIKLLDRPYDYGSRKNWIKCKPVKEATFKVIGYEPGEGKYQGMVGALNVVDASGLIKCNVGSGLDDDMRQHLMKIDLNNLYIDVMYNEISKNKNNEYSLRFPRFLKIRDDKNKADNVYEKNLKS